MSESASGTLPVRPGSGDRDTLYREHEGAIEGFRFDERVARVFADMISRSVPGYGLSLRMLAVATREYAQAHSNCYDLGCSLGASTLSIRHNAPDTCRVIGIDNSQAMVERARAAITADSCSVAAEIRCEDIREAELSDASMVTLNFTLQFIPCAERERLLRRIACALRPGGCLILSEKIAFTDPAEQELLSRLHHGFKQLEGYSELEIAHKRSALENVLLPETLDTHRSRLLAAGFSRVTPWLQCLNFVSLLAQL